MEVWPWVMYPLVLSGIIFQIVINYRAKSFAGNYKWTAWAEFVEMLLRLTPHTLSWISGSAGGAPGVLRDGFLLEDLVLPKRAYTPASGKISKMRTVVLSAYLACHYYTRDPLYISSYCAGSPPCQ
jgi:hypothetical protein